MQIHYEVVPAGGQRDTNNAEIIADTIKQGGMKGWKFVSVISDFGQNFVVFEKPATRTKEQRG